jgi:hypothetical protein
MRRVNVYVDQPSCIELHVRETVRLDRLQPTGVEGYMAEQHGGLLAPGVTRLPLEKRIYHFRTLDDAQPSVIAGGVEVDSMSGDDKDGPFPDPSKTTAGATTSVVWGAVAAKGHGPCGRVPALRVVDATAGAPQAVCTGHPSRRRRTRRPRRRRWETCDHKTREERI